jgi:hypothetical protein
MVAPRKPGALHQLLDEIRQIRKDVRLVLWSLIVLLLPFYLFDSGIPQFADMLSAVLMAVLLKSWTGKLPGPFIKPLASLRVFIFYVFLVNLGWSFASLTFTLDSKIGFLLAPTFYVFNGLMFFTFILMFQRYGELLVWLTARLVLVSVFLQVAMSFVVHRGAGRGMVFFNNPNQLGYYALLSACVLLLGQKRRKLSTPLVTAGLAMCAYLALLSASKAALASIAVLGIALVISKLRTVVMMLVVFAVLIFTDNPFSQAIERAAQRIDTDESQGFFEERGYDRIVEYPEYWFAGAGEGAYQRFRETSAIGAHELHSSIATLFFCYGIIGVVLFASFMFGVISGAGIYSWIIVATGFAYGMTHQGLRFRLLWLMLGMVAALRELARRDRIARAQARSAAQVRLVT